MQQTTSLIVLGYLLLQTTNAVDIGNFEEVDCDWNELLIGCRGQPERICCGFPQTLINTWSVGFRGLQEGDIATWFHEGPRYPVLPSPGNPNPRPVRNHCGGIRRAQVMMGEHNGALCMNVPDGEHHEDNDGANWQIHLILILYFGYLLHV